MKEIEYLTVTGGMMCRPFNTIRLVTPEKKKKKLGLIKNIIFYVISIFAIEL